MNKSVFAFASGTSSVFAQVNCIELFRLDDFGAVTLSADDRLGRASFAESLASFIYNLPPSAEGFVIGLEGEWGSGKSSVINMVCEKLLHLEMERRSTEKLFYDDAPAHLDIGTLTRLAKAHKRVPDWPITVDRNFFFRDVVKRGLCAAAVEPAEEAKLVYRYFRLREQVKASPQNLQVVFQPWLVPEATELASFFVRELSIAIGQKFGAEVADRAGDYRRAVAEIAPVAGAATNLVAPGLGGVIESLGRIFAQPIEATLESKKQALEAALRKLRHRKIIVFVDDLDRLLPREAIQMMALLKGLGRLPNVVYVLSYDQSNLARLLKKATKLDGTEYLEKIVQYKRPLPLLKEGALSLLIDGYLDKASPPIEGRALRRLQEAWGDIINRTIRTPRDAIRLGSGFLTGWQQVGAFLDASDFLIVQFTLHHDITLYKWIRANLKVLCGLGLDVSGTKLKDRLGEMNLDSNVLRKRVLALLFPKAAEILGTYGSSGLRTARADRRLHVYDYRSAYFDLSSPIGAFSRIEVDELLAAAEPLELLTDFIDRSEDSSEGTDMRKALLSDLRYYFGDGTPIPLPMAKALVAISPRLIRQVDKDIDFFSEDNSRRLRSILFRGLDAIGEIDRGPFLIELIRNASDYSLLAGVTRSALGPRDQTKRDREGLSLNGWEEQVRGTLLEVVRKLASDFSLLHQASPGTIIWFWNDSEPDEVREFLAELLEDEEYFPDIVELITSEVNSSERGLYETLLSDIDTVVSKEKLDERASELSTSFDPRIAAAVERYKQARSNFENPD